MPTQDGPQPSDTCQNCAALKAELDNMAEIEQRGDAEIAELGRRVAEMEDLGHKANAVMDDALARLHAKDEQIAELRKDRNMARRLAVNVLFDEKPRLQAKDARDAVRIWWGDEAVQELEDEDGAGDGHLPGSGTIIHPASQGQPPDEDYDLEPPPRCVAKNTEAIEKLRGRVRKSVAHVNALDVTLASAIARFNREADGFRSTHDLLGLLQDRVGRLEVNDD